ncbi:hypothetical protein ACFVWC_27985 [Bacillus mycoides]|uniref:hypothetical protein n=1 Tax=Bacillus mycoides TaxID=1405 RepID=UPI0036E94C97
MKRLQSFLEESLCSLVVSCFAQVKIDGISFRKDDLYEKFLGCLAFGVLMFANFLIIDLTDTPFIASGWRD